MIIAALLCGFILVYFIGWMVVWFVTRHKPVNLKGKGMK